ncbi:hypothetical protein BDQ17DRAFT_1333219 [Cyathus striatus]|nr:hypothetical protein BDQ17DRAFT_1333219 [Cyathus striatus]
MSGRICLYLSQIPVFKMQYEYWPERGEELKAGRRRKDSVVSEQKPAKIDHPREHESQATSRRSNIAHSEVKHHGYTKPKGGSSRSKPGRDRLHVEKDAQVEDRLHAMASCCNATGPIPALQMFSYSVYHNNLSGSTKEFIANIRGNDTTSIRRRDEEGNKAFRRASQSGPRNVDVFRGWVGDGRCLTSKAQECVPQNIKLEPLRRRLQARRHGRETPAPPSVRLLRAKSAWNED